MQSNPVTCGNCGTENPPDQDFCVECGQPLTGSADEAVRESLAAEERTGAIGGGSPGLGIGGAGLTAAAGGVAPVYPLSGEVDPAERAD